MLFTRTSVPELEQKLTDLEAQVSALRAQQGVVLRELDHANAPLRNASRSMGEWVQSHLDIDPRTARDLVYLARSGVHHRVIWSTMADGEITFDRMVSTVRYAEAGASEDEIERSAGHDLAGLRKLTSHKVRVTSHDERAIHDGRFFAIQPTLDESRYRLWGELPGMEGRIVERAIHDRADEFHRTAGDLPTTKAQRLADALTAISRDSLDGVSAGAADSTTATVTVFVDATRDEAADTAATVAFGPRVGPHALERILCDGTVRIIGLDGATPVVSSRAARTIPTPIRHAVMHRDGGCTIDGCRSRYRLQPHHIQRFADGGSHTMDNLTTLCWYHHHVAVHGSGYHLDPDSPPLRHRLVRGVSSGADPPRLAA